MYSLLIGKESYRPEVDGVFQSNNHQEARVSTRGVIARQKGDAFEGRYHHWDSYPSGLGKALWELAHNEFKGDIEGMLRILIDEHPAGWSTIVNKDFSLAIPELS